MDVPRITLPVSILLCLIASISKSQPKEAAADKEKKPLYTTNLNKNDYFIGGTVGLSTKKTSNRDIFLYNIDNEDNSTFSFRFDGGYALKDNLFVGLGIQYGESRKKGNYTDTDNSTSYKQFYEYSMSIKPFIKNYVPLGESRRLNLVTQTEFSFSINQSLLQSEQNDDITRTHLNQYEIGIGIRPGLLVFIVNNFAIETSVNVAGISYSYSRQKTTNQPKTTINKGNIDLKIDILQLNLGFFVYL